GQHPRRCRPTPERMLTAERTVILTMPSAVMKGATWQTGRIEEQNAVWDARQERPETKSICVTCLASRACDGVCEKGSVWHRCCHIVWSKQTSWAANRVSAAPARLSQPISIT